MADWGDDKLVSNDPNYWKNIYKEEWANGSERVRKVINMLRGRCPEYYISPLDYALIRGYIPPDSSHERHDPDVCITKGDQLLCFIEVTGSNISMAETDFAFILEGKFNVALDRLKKSVSTWFFAVYSNRTCIFSIAILRRFVFSVEEKMLKGVPERYLSIPVNQSLSLSLFMDWLHGVAFVDNTQREMIK